jgi:hypothetical protein
LALTIKLWAIIIKEGFVIKYEWTDLKVMEEIGWRFQREQLRQNLPLETLFSINTLKRLEKGRAKLETMIIVLRDLGMLEELNNFIAPAQISPIEIVRMRWHQRKRASRPRTKKAGPFDTWWKRNKNDL